MDTAKKASADAACAMIKDGMKIGLGTGSTAEYAIKKIGELIEEGYDLRGVPSSRRTESVAKSVRIPLIPYGEFIANPITLDINIDGADRIDPQFRLIKGGGGAHTREKQVAEMSKLFCCIADQSKLVPKLVGSFPLPVEVEPDLYREACAELKDLGELRLREIKGKVFITDNSNYVVDVSLTVGEPERLEVDINKIPGVVDNGFFARRRPELVFVGDPNGKVQKLER